MAAYSAAQEIRDVALIIPRCTTEPSSSFGSGGLPESLPSCSVAPMVEAQLPSCLRQGMAIFMERQQEEVPNIRGPMATGAQYSGSHRRGRCTARFYLIPRMASNPSPEWG